ncbi:hypothetical protein [Flavobacterium eburneipallidum]|uniref:hypothetical protein n=1 Tax=Flavobacterium eburneipallidum TaxID=3003263 RepID=UPI002482323B|nr:hypothetical protein [Flavobacterium eburneipallidum]
MEKWSTLLIKNEISEFLIDKLKADFPTISSEDLKTICQKIYSKKSIKLIAKIIDDNKQNISKSVIKEFKEEISEIKSDLVWKITSKGKSTIYINDWVQNFYAEFRSNEKFENVYIGGHSENENIIYVTGELNEEKDKISLFEYIKSKNPQLKLMFNLKVKVNN